MKTMFLLLVALALSAQGIDETIHRAPFAKPYMPDEYFTMHRLNGYWWKNATPVERQIYLLAWYDATGIIRQSVSGDVYDRGYDLNLPFRDVLKSLGNLEERRRHLGPEKF